MSWLSDLADSVGSVFGSSTAVPSKDSNQLGGGFYGSLLTAGLGLVGQYYNAKDQRKLAEQYMEQRKAELEYAKSQAGGGGADKEMARKALLAQLYSAWASNTGEMGKAYGQIANQTGGNVSGAISARMGKLA